MVLVFTVIWGSWVTPFEKRAINAALAEIENVRSFRGQDGLAYREQVSKAKASVTLCKKRAITEYDSRMVMLVDTDLDGALSEQKIWELPDSNTHKKRILDVLTGVNQSTESMIRSHIQ